MGNRRKRTEFKYPNVRRCVRVSVLAAAAFITLVAFASNVKCQVDQASKDAFFETKIRPLLVDNCFVCHSVNDQKGGLRLDSRAAMLKGNAKGSVLSPGDPDHSAIIKAISYDGRVKMPPAGKMSPSQIAALTEWVKMGAPWPEPKGGPVPKLEKFIIKPEQRNFWSFRPIAVPPLPKVKAAAWCKSPIDQFILARLEQKGLSPAPKADKRTLIRRAYFDLVGLPPSQEQVHRFLADTSPNAFARVIDGLLASPHFGERWARHWLDVVRYCDSLDSRGIGSEGDVSEAWKYRDWVVDALNRDVHFTDFIKYQIAGDLLPKASETRSAEALPAYLRGAGDVNAAGIIASSLLSIGNWGNGDADKDKILTDIADDQLDVVSRGFMGITLACARCHNHKFDPFSQKDYYALAGIFFSTHTLPKLTPKGAGELILRVPLVSGAELAKRQEYADKVAYLDKELKAKSEEAYRGFAKSMLPQTSRYLVAALEYAAIPKDQAKPPLSKFASERSLHEFALRQWLNCLSGGEFRLMSTQIRDLLGNAGVSGWKGPNDTPSLLVNTNDAAKTVISFMLPPKSVAIHPGPTTGVAVSWRSPISGQVQITGKVSDADPNGGDGIAWIIDLQKSGRSKELASGDFPNAGVQEFAAGAGAQNLKSVTVAQGDVIHLMVLPKQSHTCDTTVVDLTISQPGGRSWNLARDLQTDPLQGNPHPDGFGNAGVWSFLDMADGRSSRPQNEKGDLWAEWDAALDAFAAGKADRNAVERAADQFQSHFMVADNKSPFWINNPQDMSALPEPSRSSLSDLNSQLEALRKSPPPPLVYANGAQDGGVPESPHAGVHDVRLHIRGSYARLGEVIPRGFPEVLGGDREPPIKEGSGRLQLAEWLGKPGNPLTSRVIVNRVWQHLFGEGIVRTPSNFGWLGERPTHPDLLDWLAVNFQDRENGGAGERENRSDDLSSSPALPFSRSLKPWSLKSLIRTIMLSSTYQQSSIPPELSAKLDADNRLFSRMNRKRMESEAVRDNILAVSGKLDLALGGPAIRDFATNRRTLYVMSVRSDRTGFGPLFDMADSTSQVDRRTVSVVAPQALFMMNNPFVMEQTRTLAKRIAGAGADDHTRIDMAYNLLYGRPPSSDEVKIGLKYLNGARTARASSINQPGPRLVFHVEAASRDSRGSGDARTAAWEEYCQILLCANEFIYVD